MKIAFAIMLACVTTGLAHAERSPAYAKDGRIVTLEHWGWHSATVWAVRCDRIVVYKVFDTAEPDQLLAEIPITKAQSDKISAGIRAIPKQVRGRVFMPRGVFDGTMLRVSFTPDGSFANDRIEVQNLWMPWLADVTQSISGVLPEKHKIRFKERIEEQDREWPGNRPRIESFTIEKYYEVPNQSSQPTPGS